MVPPVNYPTQSAPATPEYVLAVFEEWRRLGALFGDYADPDVRLTFDMTVREWRRLDSDTPLDFDLTSTWRRLSHALSEWWGIGATDAEWRAALDPQRTRTLGDVCALIARHATRPVARPHPLFGCDGRAAGMFLTVRSLLADAGADVARVTPSTELAPFRRLLFDARTLTVLGRLAPGTLSTQMGAGAVPLTEQVVGLIILAAVAAGGFAAVLGHRPACGVAAGVVVACVVALLARAPVRTPVYGELRTFRDLARCLAAGAAWVHLPPRV